jgi:nitroreductase
MTLAELVEKRVSVRQFLPDPVAPDHIREMVRLASLAPSPNNQQPWGFIAVTRQPLLHQMAATELGYGSCWLSGPLIAREDLEQLLGVEAPEQLAALVTVGVPAAPPSGGHDRRRVEEILQFIG